MLQDEFFGLSPAGWAAVAAMATVGTFLVALLAVLLARRQLRLAINQLEEQRQTQVEADRPYVIVNFQPSPATRVVQDLVICNIGRRPAFKVRISTEPTLSSTLDGGSVHIAAARILTHGTEMLAPGQEIRTVFDSTIQRGERKDLPHTFHITATYKDSQGRDYTDESDVEWNTLEGAAYVEVYTLHDIGKALKGIEKKLDARSRR